MTTWNVTYRSPIGELHIAQFVGGLAPPSKNEAAIKIAGQLIGNVFVLPDIPANTPDKTVYLLESYGYSIMGIDRARTTFIDLSSIVQRPSP